MLKPVIEHVIGARLGETAKRLRTSPLIHVLNRMPCQNRGMYQAKGCFTTRRFVVASRGSVSTLMLARRSKLPRTIIIAKFGGG
jgi:hypothetical protein